MQTKPILLNHIQNRSKQVRPILTMPEKGWIRQMREALGLTLEKLGHLCGVSTATIAQAERREIEGNLTIETLRKTAEAMNCEFVYMFAPKSDMSEFVNQSAYKKAQRILKIADLHMSLENQKVKIPMDERVVKLQKKLIAEGKAW